MTESNPEVSFFWVSLHVVTCIRVCTYRCMFAWVCVCFSLHVVCNVSFGVKNGRDGFDGTIKIFEVLKQLQRCVISAAL